MKKPTTTEIFTLPVNRISKCLGAELYPVKLTDNDSVEIAKNNGDADFWSVYVRFIDGSVQCVADAPTYSDATPVFELLAQIITRSTLA